MKLPTTIATLTVWLILVSCKPQVCYECRYDMVKERLCLTDNRFSFELSNPFDDNLITASGYFEQKNDTLIFSPGVKPSDIQITKCQLIASKSDGNEIKIIDLKNNVLSSTMIKIKDKLFSVNDEGIIKLEGPIPESISISLISYDKRLWSGPINSYYKVDLNYEKNEGNQLVIQIDPSKALKIPYEHEVRLLKIKSSLYYFDEQNNISNLRFTKTLGGF